MRRRFTLVTVVLVGLGLALVGLGACSGGDDESSSASDTGDEMSAEGGLAVGDAPATTMVGAASEGDDGGGAESAATGADPAAQQGEPLRDEQRIVYTSDLRVRTDDPTRAARRAVAIAEDAGGTLDGQTDDTAARQVQVTVRVPSDAFSEVLDDVAALGRVLDRDVRTEDVTDQAVDLDSRLANARASVERLRGLYADAQDVNHVVAIEAALTQREAEVESLAGQLRLLEDRADRSTITVTFVEEAAPPAVDEDIPGFGGGLRNGWVAFRNVASGGATAAGFGVPFLAIAAPLALVALWIRRRRHLPPRPSSPAPAEP